MPRFPCKRRGSQGYVRTRTKLEMKKNYVLDTNVLLHDPRAIFRFEDNDVIIPIYVIEEVDQFKREGTERGRNARTIARLLDDLRDKGGSLSTGVPLDLGRKPARGRARQAPRARVRHRPRRDGRGHPPDRLRLPRAGRRQADRLRDDGHEPPHPRGRARHGRRDVREHARRSGAPRHRHQRARRRRSRHRQLLPGGPRSPLAHDGVARRTSASSCATARAPRTPRSAATTSTRREVVALRTPREGVIGVRPRNKEQSFAIDLLLDESVRIVTLVGKAGTGKTLLAIAAGLKKTIEDGTYTRMLVSRPVMPLGRDIGYLPGDVDEKLNPWMQPIFDNLEFLFSTGSRRGPRAYAELLESGQIQVEPLTYIRGRSLPQQFIIVDEAQNLTPHEVKTIITRSGDGTKIVLTGDPQQIDNPYVDSASNGLTIAADKFRGEKLAGHVVARQGRAQRSRRARREPALSRPRAGALIFVGQPRVDTRMARPSP